VSRSRSSGAPTLVVAAVIVATLAASAGRAQATHTQKDPSGELSGGSLGVGIETAQGAQPGAPPGPVDSHSSSLPALVHYVWTPLPGGPLGSLEGLCNAAGTAAGGNEPVFGWLYRVEAWTRDGRLVSDTLDCVAFPGAPRSTPPPPPVAPTPPTIGDVWRAVPLPRPIIGANPVGRGVTGLATLMWSGGGQTAQVAVSIGGLRVVGTASLVEYRFATDEGGAGSSTTPGHASRPAAAHRFVRKGAHTLSVSSVWRANVTLIGPDGAAPVPIDLDTAVLTLTVAYPVTEVRSRLVG